MTALGRRSELRWLIPSLPLLIAIGCGDDPAPAGDGAAVGSVSGSGAESGAPSSAGSISVTPAGGATVAGQAGSSSGAADGGHNQTGGGGASPETMAGAGGDAPVTGLGGAGASAGSGSSGAAGQGGYDVVAGGGGETGGEAGSGGFQLASLPCDVREVLAARCTTCHAPTPINDAPMSLQGWEDVNAYAQAIQEKLEQDLMPPPGAPDLTEAELTTVVNYVSIGAPPAVPMACP